MKKPNLLYKTAKTQFVSSIYIVILMLTLALILSFPKPSLAAKTYASEVNTSWKLTADETIAGNLLLSKGTVDLNGYKLTVDGNLIQSGGALKPNGGQLTVKGDYRIHQETLDSSGVPSYSAGDGRLEMSNNKDKILVNGDFLIGTSYYDNNSGFNMRAGILEIKGDFTQKHYTDSNRKNFAPYSNSSYGDFRVVLSGNNQQTISFDDPGDSYFNILSVSNARSIKCATYVSIMRIVNDYTFPGDLYLCGGLNLDGYNLTVDGSLIQSGGALKPNGGQLTVKGDYRIHQETLDSSGVPSYSAGDGRIEMSNNNDKILVNGDFLIGTSYYDNNSGYNMRKGILEIKGDFTQKHYTDSNRKNFAPYSNSSYGDFRVVLSGNNQQTISFDDPGDSYFNILSVSNARSIKCMTYVSIMRIVNDYTFPGDLYLCNGLNLDGYKLTVDGSLIQSGGALEPNGGQLTVKGDYRIHQETLDSSGVPSYSAGDGRIEMSNNNDKILVNGDFLIGTSYYDNNSGYNMRKGILEIKGDFTQKHYTDSNRKNFAPYSYGDFKVVLSGSDQQTVHFDDPDDSYFKSLSIKNALVDCETETGIDLSQVLLIKASEPGSCRLCSDPKQTISLKFSHDIKEGTAYNNIRLINEAENSWSLEKTINGSNLNLSISGDLPRDQVVTLEIPAGAVTGVNGEQLPTAAKLRYAITDKKELPGSTEYTTWKSEDTPNKRIDQNKTWKVTFSKSINLESTIANQLLYVIEASTGLLHPVELSVDSEKSNVEMRVNVKPIFKYSRGGQYYLVIDKSMQSDDGDNIKNGIILPFTINDY